MAQLTESVRLEQKGDIAVITISNPPVNALSYHVRQGLIDGIKEAETSSATAIVLICDGRTFIAGADITEFSQAPKPPSLQAGQDAMENCFVYIQNKQILIFKDQFCEPQHIQHYTKYVKNDRRHLKKKTINFTISSLILFL